MANYLLVITGRIGSDNQAQVGQVCSYFERRYNVGGFVFGSYDDVSSEAQKRSKDYPTYIFTPIRINIRICRLLNKSLATRVLYLPAELWT